MKWQDPPAKRWDPIAEELRNNPQRWALVEVPHPSYGAHIKRGKLKAFRPVGAFEVKNSKGEIYIRYIGEQS